MRASIKSISDDVVRIIELELEDSVSLFRFLPGQYTSVMHPNGKAIPFSIASSPHRLPELALHFQAIAGAPEAALMTSLLTVGNVLELAPPAGNTFLQDSTTPLLFVCGGTGVAQAWAMLEWLAHQPACAPITMLWCVDSAEQLYLQDALHALDLPIELETCVDARRDARNSGMLWLTQHAPHLRERKIVLCGGPAFVWAAVDALHAIDESGWRLASDVFDYAPRAG